jgi:hypothetical protein
MIAVPTEGGLPAPGLRSVSLYKYLHEVLYHLIPCGILIRMFVYNQQPFSLLFQLFSPWVISSVSYIIVYIDSTSRIKETKIHL